MTEVSSTEVYRGFCIEEISYGCRATRPADRGFIMEFVNFEEAHEFIDGSLDDSSESKIMRSSSQFPTETSTSLERCLDYEFQGVAFVLRYDAGLYANVSGANMKTLSGLGSKTIVYRTERDALRSLKYRISQRYEIFEIIFDGKGYYKIGKRVV